MTNYSSYKFKNIVFEITVEEEDGHFYNKWKCECGEIGGSSEAFSDEQSATLATKTNAASHVGAKHK
jgi:hypothetical protein